MVLSDMSSPVFETTSDDSSCSALPSDSILPHRSRRKHRYADLQRQMRHQARNRSGNHLTRKLLCSAVVIIYIATLAIVIWLALILTVANRLRIPTPSNGLERILRNYRAPNASSPANPTWLEDFSADILPVPCHAHNDYWHRVPLYEGLAVGCVSTEADIWLGKLPNGDAELFVGHNSKSLIQSRTLRSLYLDPLKDILTQQQIGFSANLSTSSNAIRPPLDTTPAVGVYSMSPNTTLVLVLDFKTRGNDTWLTVLAQLHELRSRGWLTTWTLADGIIQRPVTVVATGDAPFYSIIANETYRDVFYDAPLTDLPTDTAYNSNNSYYASTSLYNAIGKIRWSRLSSEQKVKITHQVERAAELGLGSRYWDTPSWPVGLRNRVWESLIELGADMLNVDDLTAVARWDWQMCVVGGINICNS